MASQHNFTQISSIDDIIIHIYKFLDFGDKLRLSCVNSQFKIIFKSYVWKEEYTSLKVYKDTPNFVITNGNGENRLCLKPKEYQEFLRTYADDVIDLTIQNSELPGETMEHDVDLNYFQNLLSFKYEQMTIPVDVVKVIAEKNTNLQELTLISYSYQLYATEELFKCILLKMLNLKRLRIETSQKLEIKLSQFRRILSKSKLESLKLNAVILWHKTTKESEKSFTMPIGLKKFALSTLFDPLKWPSDFTSYFRNFKSLTALTITTGVEVTDEILATIAEICNSLKKMRFEFTSFSDVQLFRVPFSVMEFTLFDCDFLSYENLEQILSQYNITKFYSTHTQYEGEFEDFNISPLIETLHITGDFPTLKFESAYKANKNLKELTWYDDSLTYITPSFPLKHCINLHTLNLLHCQMNLDTLLELTSLRKLVMQITEIQWSFVTQLLQHHSSLQELIIRKYKCYGSEYPRMDLPSSQKGFATQVCSLEIPFDMLVLALDFWLDLFVQNKSLILICWTNEPYERFGEAIKDIINHRNFPKSMKTVDVCGFQTDCKFIRNHYEDFLKKLQIQTKKFIFMSKYDKNGYLYEGPMFINVKSFYLCRITLYRK